MQKIYCYVDETGQDTRGKFFLVAAFMADAERDALLVLLETFEQESGKGPLKWVKVPVEKQSAYMKLVLARQEFHGKLYYATHFDSTEYPLLTMQSTALAIHTHVKDQEFSTTVHVDGLTKKGEQEFANYLRKEAKISPCKVRGRTDDNDPGLRLADAVAGFTRAAIEGHTKHRTLWEKAIREGYIIEVKKE